MKVHFKSATLVSVTPEDADDIWTLYNIITVKDEVEAETIRKVIQESSSGGHNDSRKVKMWMKVSVEKADADLKAASLRLNGKNIRENEHVKMGAYHTLEVEPGRRVKIEKPHGWSRLDWELLEQAADPQNKAFIAAVMIDLGTAVFAMIDERGEVRVLEKLTTSVPKKKISSSSKLDGAVEKFFTQTIEKFLQVFELERLKAIVFASPLDWNQVLQRKLFEYASAREAKSIFAVKNKIICLPVQSMNVDCLKVILNVPQIAQTLKDTKSAKESKYLDDLFKQLHGDSDLAIFGEAQVTKAADQGAVKVLLLCDCLFRSSDISNRKKYALMVDTVKQNGGQVCIVGQESEARLMTVTGCAALLTFPLID